MSPERLESHAEQGPPRWRIIPGPREEEGSPYPKASLWLRGGARTVDVLVAWGLWVLLGQVGLLGALVFLLLADGMLIGQSIGKRIFGVRVMHLPTRSAGRHRDSAIRNAPLALIALFGMLPPPLGAAAFLGSLAVIGGTEIWATWRDPLGQRRGDHWAQTQVVDAKIVLGASIAERHPAHPRSRLSAPGGGLERRKRRRLPAVQAPPAAQPAKPRGSREDSPLVAKSDS